MEPSSVTGPLPDHDEYERVRFRDALDQIVLEALPPASLGLAILYVVISVAHLLVLPRTLAIPMSIRAIVTSLLLFGLHAALERWSISPCWAHPIAAVVTGLVLLNSLLHLYIRRQPRQTTNFMLVVVGCGFLFLSGRWYIGSLLAVLAAWVPALFVMPSGGAWMHFGIGLFIATGLSVIAHVNRVQTFRRVTRLHLRDQRRQAELEDALTVARRSQEEYRELFQEAPVCLWEEDFSEVKIYVERLRDDGVRDLREYFVDHPEALTRCASLVKVVRVSRATLDLYDAASVEEFRGGLDRILAEESWDVFAAELLALTEGQTRFEREAVNYTLEGEKKHVLLRLSLPPDYEQTWSKVLISITDISQRKEAEERLSAYREHLEEMVAERTEELREAQLELLEQQRLEREAQLAAEVQGNLLPDRVPSLDGFEFAATALPARYVSGDLYDFLDDEKVCHIALADVAGKGIPAAMLNSAARVLHRAEIDRDKINGNSPRLILSNVQRALHEDLEQAEVFITFLSAKLDAEFGRLTYANAGHVEPLWWRHERNGVPLSSTALPVGILSDNEVGEEEIELRPGDRIIFYSDGVTDAINPQRERFGKEQFMDVLREYKGASAETIRDRIIEAIERFRSGEPLADDLTLIVLGVSSREVNFSCPGDLAHLDEATTFVRKAVAAYGEEIASEVDLAVSEIITNVARHAYVDASGDVQITVGLLPDEIQLDIFDRGRSFDPESVPEPDLGTLREDGYGLVIVRRIMDIVDYQPDTADGNRWRLVKHVGEQEEQ